MGAQSSRLSLPRPERTEPPGRLARARPAPCGQGPDRQPVEFLRLTGHEGRAEAVSAAAGIVTTITRGATMTTTSQNDRSTTRPSARPESSGRSTPERRARRAGEEAARPASQAPAGVRPPGRSAEASPTQAAPGPAPAPKPLRPGVLPPEEQLALAALAKQNGCVKSRARLVQANIGLVASIARRFRCRSLAFEDLVSEGMIGLVRAIDEFDPSRCVRFASFAARLIERSIQHAVGEASGPVRLPPKARRLMARWRRASHRYEMLNGMPAEPTDLAPELGVSVRAARSLETAEAMISGGSLPPDAIGAHPDGSRAGSSTSHADGSAAELIERVRAGIDQLDPCAASIVRMTFGLSGSPQLPLRAIADQTGLSVERVRHTLSRALGSLRRTAGSGETPGRNAAGRPGRHAAEDRSPAETAITRSRRTHADTR